MGRGSTNTVTGFSWRGRCGDSVARTTTSRPGHTASRARPPGSRLLRRHADRAEAAEALAAGLARAGPGRRPRPVPAVGRRARPARGARPPPCPAPSTCPSSSTTRSAARSRPRSCSTARPPGSRAPSPAACTCSRRTSGTRCAPRPSGVGQLLARRRSPRAPTRVVVGLGGSATSRRRRRDARRARGRRARPRRPPAAARRRRAARRRPAGRTARPALAGVELVAATDVDVPLAGALLFAPQKGATDDDVALLGPALARWADALERHLGVAVARPARRRRGRRARRRAARPRRPARERARARRRAVRLAERVERADLVVTGEGSFDATSLLGKATGGVAALAQAAGVPCLVLAGQVHVGRREAAARGRRRGVRARRRGRPRCRARRTGRVAADARGTGGGGVVAVGVRPLSDLLWEAQTTGRRSPAVHSPPGPHPPHHGRGAR